MSKPGRPLNSTVTAALMASTIQVLGQFGLAAVNADSVSTHARAGKAAIYRRWSSVPELITQALTACTLVNESPATGDLRSDLLLLVAPWQRPLSDCERAAAALLGHAGRDTEFGRALDAAVTQPIAASVALIASAQAERGQTLPASQTRMLVMVVQSMWWQRYITNPEPLSAAGVADLVDHVLVLVATRP